LGPGDRFRFVTHSAEHGVCVGSPLDDTTLRIGRWTD